MRCSIWYFSPLAQSIATMSTRTTPVLWQLLIQCLANPQCNPSIVEWISKEQGIFKLTNAPALASMWGAVKSTPKMNADHFKRGLR